ncbi:MAG: hypothetical protein JNM55_13990 [Anaerolineales bacterium]|nr:hypothetical protein [Anaerolineales bacterium]
MGVIKNEFEYGETIVFKINRGRKFVDIYKAISRDVFLLPLMGYFYINYFSTMLADFPRPTSVDPALVQLLVPACISSCIFVPALMLIAVGILDLIHLFKDELILTNKRIIGYGQSSFAWSFRSIDIRLEDVRDIKIKQLSLEIHTNDERPILMTRLEQKLEFIEKFRQLKGIR